MKNANSRGRPRSRNMPGKRTPNRNQVFESNGPGVRVRGNAQQLVEKYLAMARDATSQGDRILAENCHQHADHYQRVLNALAGRYVKADEHNAAAGPENDETDAPVLEDLSETGANRSETAAPVNEASGSDTDDDGHAAATSLEAANADPGDPVRAQSSLPLEEDAAGKDEQAAAPPAKARAERPRGRRRSIPISSTRTDAAAPNEDEAASA